MSEKQKVKIHFYEHLIYWPITVIVLLLAVPILIFRLFHFLIRATGAPLKSVGNFIGFISVVSVLAGGLILYQIFLPYDFTGEIRSLMVDENDRFPTIAANMRKCGIIRGEYLFRGVAVLTGIDKMIIPGRYDFTGKVSLYDVLMKIKRQEIAVVRLTIPEGSTVYRTASLLAEGLGIDSAAFVARASDTAFTRSKYDVEGLEGYLFPDTYLFWYGIKIDGIINMMVTQYAHKTAGLLDSLPPQINSRRELLTLASIIEAEAGLKEEMPLISSVYHNRLKEKMLLQADPTVIYALGEVNRTLNYDDLKFDSPYNTYCYGGLPPGPINSPGLAAIKAALHPAESKFIYFVANGEGGHIFSRTLDEHNTAKMKIRVMKKNLKMN
jgi:peptidoglycan lytic transglycosylase G